MDTHTQENVIKYFYTNQGLPAFYINKALTEAEIQELQNETGE